MRKRQIKPNKTVKASSPKYSSKRSRSVYTLCLILLLVLFCLVFHALSNHKTPSFSNNKSQSNTLKNEQNIIPKEDNKLNSNLNSWASELEGNYSIYVKEVGGQNRFATFDSDRQMVPASSYKIYLAYAILKGVETGEIDNQQTLGCGNIRNCLSKMIVNSDNQSGRDLGFMIGWQNVNKQLKSIGLNSTNLDNYVYDNNNPAPQPTGDKITSANDIGLFLEKLINNELLSKEDTEYLIGLMKNQTWRERIPSGVPKGVMVADKPGWLPSIQTDAGVIYLPTSKLILVIFSSSNDNPANLAILTSKIYNYLLAD